MCIELWCCCERSTEIYHSAFVGTEQGAGCHWSVDAAQFQACKFQPLCPCWSTSLRISLDWRLDGSQFQVPIFLIWCPLAVLHTDSQTFHSMLNIPDTDLAKQTQFPLSHFSFSYSWQSQRSHFIGIYVICLTIREKTRHTWFWFIQLLLRPHLHTSICVFEFASGRSICSLCRRVDFYGFRGGCWHSIGFVQSYIVYKRRRSTENDIFLVPLVRTHCRTLRAKSSRGRQNNRSWRRNRGKQFFGHRWLASEMNLLLIKLSRNINCLEPTQVIRQMTKTRLWTILRVIQLSFCRQWLNFRSALD